MRCRFLHVHHLHFKLSIALSKHNGGSGISVSGIGGGGSSIGGRGSSISGRGSSIGGHGSSSISSRGGSIGNWGSSIGGHRGGNSSGLLVDIGLSRDLDINVGLGGDLLMDVGLSRDLDINVGLSSRVGVGVGHRGVIGGSIDSSIDSGGGGISGNWGGSIGTRGTHNSAIGIGSGGSGIAITTIAGGIGEGTSIAIASVGNHLSLGHGGTESDNSDKSLHFV